MKKSILLSLVLISIFTLSACGKNSDESNIIDDNVNWLSESVSDLSDNESENSEIIGLDCQPMIEKYLKESNKEWSWEEIKVWDNIVVDYIWRLEDWTVFDTSIEEIAKSCGKYNEWRNYKEWLWFEVWAWQMIKWFDEWVVWMKEWQTKTVKFWPEKWYGQRNEQYVMTYSSDEVWDLSKFTEGQTVYLWIWAVAKITKVTDNEVTLDLNHELAWKDLIFDITIKSVN